MWCPAAVMRRCLDIDNVPGGEDFFAGQGGLAQKYFVYFKSNQRIMAGKARRLGNIGNFKRAPKAAKVIIWAPAADCQWFHAFYSPTDQNGCAGAGQGNAAGRLGEMIIPLTRPPRWGRINNMKWPGRL